MSDPLTVPSTDDDLLRELALLATEHVEESLRDLDTWSTVGMLDMMNAFDREVPDAVSRSIPTIALLIDGATERLRRGGRLIYIGAGTPGRLGIVDASECPPTFSSPPEQVIGIIAGGNAAIRSAVENAEDDSEAGPADLASVDVGPLDVVVGISASGRTPYVVAALRYAKSRGALTGAIANNEHSVIGASADHAIEVMVGPEFIAGSTRLKAGTAQKLVLNMISTITMVRLGKTLGNVMVDLHATNQKLRARSRRVVMLVTGCSVETASTVLAQTGGSAKEAILAILGGLTPEGARTALEDAKGLRLALDQLGVTPPPAAS